MPKISIVIPKHNMKDKDFFLERCLSSIRSQNYQDFEIVIMDKGGMAKNMNLGIKEAKGDILKILCMDDWFAHKNALKDIVDAFTGDVNWLMTGCDNNPHPYWTEDIETGNNKLGGLSALSLRKGLDIYFDENLSWLIDCDFYRRIAERWGEPEILDKVNVGIGLGDHQTTYLMSDEAKLAEFEYMKQKYA